MSLAKPVGGGGGVSDFDALTDTPSAKVIGQDIRVDSTGIALEYYQSRFYPEAYGAVGDGQKVTDGAISASGTTLTSASNLFIAGDVGKSIVVTGAGAAGTQLTTTIASFTGVGEVEVTAAASTTVSAANVSWGTDDTTAFQNCINAAIDGYKVVCDVKRYYFTGTLTLKRGVELTSFIVGPFDPAGVSPSENTVCPTLMLTNVTTEFIVPDNHQSKLTNILLMYPNQVQPSASTPVVYPYTFAITNVGVAGFVMDGVTFVNSYNGIQAFGGRHTFRNINMGAMNISVLIDGSRDTTRFSHFQNTPFWDTVEGLGGGQPIDTWVQANSLCFDVYSADLVMIDNFFCLDRHTFIRMRDSATYTSPVSSSYGMGIDINLDGVVYGIRADSINDNGDLGWDFVNVQFGAAAIGGTTPVWLEAGGTDAPTVSVINGALWGTWTNGAVVDAGKLVHRDIRGMSDDFVGFSTNDTTPNVSAGGLFETNNISATTITSIDGGYQGQRVTIKIDDANTTINETGNIKLNGTTVLTPENGDILDFIKDASTWYQIGGGAELGETNSGATVPTRPSDGQEFLHTPIGRTIRLQYDLASASWLPLESFGTITTYVNKTSGSDTVNQGGSTGSGAYATIDYARSQLPALSGGSIVITVTAESYIEAITLTGVQHKGDYTYTIQGTLPAASTTGTATSATAYVMGAAGAGATQATLVDTGAAWGVNAYQNFLLIIDGGTGSGQERVIDSNTATVQKIVGVWDITPDATSTYSVYDLSTGTTLQLSSLSGSEVNITLKNQKNVILKYLNLEEWHGVYGLLATGHSSFSILSCRLERSRVDASSSSAIQVEGYSLIDDLTGTLVYESAGTSLTRGMRLQVAAAPDENGNIRNNKILGTLIGATIAATGYVAANVIGGAVVGSGWVLRNQRRDGFDLNSFTRFDIDSTIIDNAARYGVIVQNLAYFIIRNNCEIANCTSDGVLNNAISITQYAGASTQINSNGGYGLQSTNQSFGNNVNAMSFTGNTLGTTTADATSTNT